MLTSLPRPRIASFQLPAVRDIADIETCEWMVSRDVETHDLTPILASALDVPAYLAVPHVRRLAMFAVGRP